jgi:hypothetical protein
MRTEQLEEHLPTAKTIRLAKARQLGGRGWLERSARRSRAPSAGRCAKWVWGVTPELFAAGARLPMLI